MGSTTPTLSKLPLYLGRWIAGEPWSGWLVSSSRGDVENRHGQWWAGKGRPSCRGQSAGVGWRLSPLPSAEMLWRSWEGCLPRVTAALQLWLFRLLSFCYYFAIFSFSSSFTFILLPRDGVFVFFKANFNFNLRLYSLMLVNFLLTPVKLCLAYRVLGWLFFLCGAWF